MQAVHTARASAIASVKQKHEAVFGGDASGHLRAWHGARLDHDHGAGDSNSPVAPVAPAHAGFDPGTTRRLAAGAFPSSPNYWESCPDSPTGRCHGTLRAGSGFYTLGGGSTNGQCD